MDIAVAIIAAISFSIVLIGTRGPLFGSSRKPVLAPVVEDEEERIDFSRIAQDVVYKFYALPESHQPAHDLRPALKALDVKYTKQAVDNHFSGGNRVLHNQPWNCGCKNGYQTSNRGNKFCNMPEYMALWFEIADIEKAIQAQERTEQERERAIELAGVQNDLASIEEITAALRAEQAIIKGATKEISDSLRKVK